MSTTRTLNRLGLLSIASAIAISAAALPMTASSADKNQQQWQQNGQSQQTHGQNQPSHGQPQNAPFRPQTSNQQPQHNGQFAQQHSNQQQFNGQVDQHRNSQQPQFNRRFTQQKNNQANLHWNQHRYDWSHYQPGHRPPQWDQHRHDVDFHAYYWNRTSAVRYHYRPYAPPHGWYYRRWVYGEVLPTFFWRSQEYWLTNYFNFGLVNPPYGYVWVRNGPDALLINVYNGQILSVEYNVFYA